MAIHSQVQKKEAQFSSLSYSLPKLELPDEIVVSGKRKPSSKKAAKKFVLLGCVLGTILGIAASFYLRIIPLPL